MSSRVVQLYCDTDRLKKAYPVTVASQVFLDDGITSIKDKIEELEASGGGSGPGSGGDVNVNVSDVEGLDEVLNKLESDLETLMNGIFKEGVLDEALKSSIHASLVILQRENSKVEMQYLELDGNADLTGIPKANLDTAKTQYDAMYLQLTKLLNTMIATEFVTAAQKEELESLYTNYKGKLTVFEQRVIQALDAIAEKKKEDAISFTEAEVEILDDKISARVTNNEFSSYKVQTASQISSKVTNDEFSTYKTQTATTIASKVSDSEFESYKTQTANSISSKVSNTDFESYKTQTADKIESIVTGTGFVTEAEFESYQSQTAEEIKNIVTGTGFVTGEEFGSYKEQTATSISSLVTDSEFESYKTQVSGAITSAVNGIDAVTDEEFGTYKEQTANAINSKVSDSEFESYKTQVSGAITSAVNGIDAVTDEEFGTYKEQTATTIASKVSDSEFESYKTQTSNSINSKVSNSEFSTYKTQTASSIASKVSSSDFESKFEQTAESFEFSLGDAQTTVQINKNALEVSHSQTDSKTYMNSNGFYIEDNEGETVAYLSSKEQWTELKADKIFASNIQTMYSGDSNLYVNHSYTQTGDGSASRPFSNFSQLTEHLMIAPIITKDITVNVVSEGNVNDYFVLTGVKGRNFTINLNKNLILGTPSTTGFPSAFFFLFCDIRILINGGRTGYNTNDGALINKFSCGFYFYNSLYAKVESLNVNSTIGDKCGVIYRNTNGETRRIDFCDSTTSVLSQQNANIKDTDSCGNSISAYRVNDGGIILYGHANAGGFRPLGTIDEHGGKIIAISERNGQASYKSIPPEPPTANYNQTFNHTSLGTYQYKWNNWSGGEAKQGIWGSYGNKAAHVFFNISDIRSYIGSGTVLDGNTITLTRKNGGGSSGATNIYINGSNRTSASGMPSYSNNQLLGTLRWNETKTFILPKTIVNALKTGSANSIAFYSSSNGSAYAEIVRANINIKVNK